MIRRSFRIGLMLGLLGGLAFLLAKVLGSRSGPDAPAWPRGVSDPTRPSVPATPAEATRLVPDSAAPHAWVEPNSSGCPSSHPVKAKLRSKIFHLPGMANYERTQPDRCYADAEQAEADGLRAAKR